MSHKQAFLDYLQGQVFNLSPVLQQFNRDPKAYKDSRKNNHIVSDIHVCIFEGSDTKDGDLGCVTFSFMAKSKMYRCRRIEYNELFKLVFCPQTANETIEAFERWREKSINTLSIWENIV